jgi:hypothetical protein
MRMDPADPSARAAQTRVAVQQAGAPREGAPGGAGPLVSPGTYRLAIRIPGIANALRGSIQISGDPEARISAVDGYARRAAVMWAYSLEKTLIAARMAMRDAGTAAGADARVRAEITRLIGVAGSLSRAMESFDSAPTADQRQQMAWAYDDAVRAIGMVNRANPEAKIAVPVRPD